MLAAALAAPAAAAPLAELSRAENRLVGRGVPDIPLRLAQGTAIDLLALSGDKPLLITFFYHRCKGICTPFLESVRDAVREVGGLGTDYRVLALSFDEADSVADLRAQAEMLGLTQSPDWLFAATNHEALARITGALDFWYRYDPASGQYDHAALLVALDRGQVRRSLLASEGGAARLRELVWELRGAFIPVYAVPGQTPLACLRFDPRSGSTRLDWGLSLLALPALLAIVLTAGVFAPRLWRRRGLNERRAVSPAR
jgi:cytochrome oxidase Cu insertion factor (SCO1/SenC/PrrC family)